MQLTQLELAMIRVALTSKLGDYEVGTRKYRRCWETYKKVCAIDYASGEAVEITSI